jgi:hypothetical protein
MPYYPLIVSEDESHFAFLDNECSFKIFFGDYHELEYQLRMPQSNSIHIDAHLLYETNSFPLYNGHCFAGLDDYGIFAIFYGHPMNPDSYPLFKSTIHYDEYDIFNKRFYLELSNRGDLSVRATSGYGQTECIWSTISCNSYLVSTNHILKHTRAAFHSFIGTTLQDTMMTMKSTFQHFIHIIFDDSTIKKQTKNIFISIVNYLKTWSSWFQKQPQENKYDENNRVNRKNDINLSSRSESSSKSYTRSEASVSEEESGATRRRKRQKQSQSNSS